MVCDRVALRLQVEGGGAELSSFSKKKILLEKSFSKKSFSKKFFSKEFSKKEKGGFAPDRVGSSDRVTDRLTGPI
jgi:hypothetical protein